MKRNLKNFILIITLISIIPFVYYLCFRELRINGNHKNIQGAVENVTDKVTFEITIGDEIIGQIDIGLFGDKAPRTVENFLAFAGDGVDGLRYKNSIFHRVIKGFMIQGGDVVSGNGAGSISKFGPSFDDELPSHKHSVVGLLSMANRGPNTNGSQFFITTVLTPWLDGKHVVFGKVLNPESMKVVTKIENSKVENGSQPSKVVRITKSTVHNLSLSDRFPVDIGSQ